MDAIADLPILNEHADRVRKIVRIFLDSKDLNATDVNAETALGITSSQVKEFRLKIGLKNCVKETGEVKNRKICTPPKCKPRQLRKEYDACKTEEERDAVFEQAVQKLLTHEVEVAKVSPEQEKIVAEIIQPVISQAEVTNVVWVDNFWGID